MRKLRENRKIAEAEAFLGMSKNTLQKWADAGRTAVRVTPANGYRMFPICLWFLAKNEPGRKCLAACELELALAA